MINVLQLDEESDDDVLDAVSIRRQHQSRQRRVILDVDSDEESNDEKSFSQYDEVDASTSFVDSVDGSVRCASSTNTTTPMTGRRPTTPVLAQHDEAELVEEMKGLNILPFVDSPRCSLQNISMESRNHGTPSKEMIEIDCDAVEEMSESTILITPKRVEITEHGVAWTFDEEAGEYYLSNRGQNWQRNDDTVCEEWPAFRIPQELYHKLYDHQISGVQWLAALHARRTGGILGGE